MVCRLLGQAPADPRPQLVVQPQEPLPVPGVQGKTDHVRDVSDHPAGEKGALHLAAAVWSPGPLQQVDERQGAVVVPVEHSGLPVTVLGQLGQPAVLTLPVIDGDLLRRGPAPPDGPHVLGQAVGVFLDEPVRRRHDFPGGAVVLLQAQDPGPGPVLRKADQGGGIGGPEAVDALILVPHQKEVPALFRQQADDPVLDLGGILGLVHTEIPVAPLKFLQDPWMLPEDPQGIDHLIVIVHPPALPKRLLIVPENLGELHPLHLDLGQFLPSQHLVFGIGDGGHQGLHRTLGCKLSRLRPVQLPQERPPLSRILQQGEGRPPQPALIGADDLAAHAVDGAELQPLRSLLPKKSGKAGTHIPGGGHGIGHGQDLLRRDPPGQTQIAHPGHQDGGLAAAWDGQQQHRTVHRLDRLLLLPIQGERISFLPLGKLHGPLQLPTAERLYAAPPSLASLTEIFW